MLSILIPTYNYNAFPLVKKLSEEAVLLHLPIEIIVLDDGSPNVLPENEAINTLPNAQFIRSKVNMGRTSTRQLLAEKAQHPKLLFLDADVMPVYKNFIARYLEHIAKKGICLGGITYKKEKPKNNEMLRWTYGHARETISVAERNKASYSTITTGCFLIEKKTFLDIHSTIQVTTYGEDLLFKQKLEAQQIPVFHIDNPVFHLGLESNEQFLKKALEAVATTIALEAKGELPTDSRNIQKIYLKLKKWQALPIFQLYYATIASKVKRNLLSENPNMRWFDLYRLNYYIQLKQKKSA